MNKFESKYFNTAKKMDNALISLLEEKAFEYITVSEICKKAGVNRSTFYLHYENTVDLLDEAVRYLINDFMTYFDVNINEIKTKFKDSSLEDLNFISDKYLHPYLLYVKDNKKVFSTALSHSAAFRFNEIFIKLYENIFDPVLERFNYPVDDRKYAMMFYLTGITAIVTEWLEDGCNRPIEEISGIIYGCIFGLGNNKLI